MNLVYNVYLIASLGRAICDFFPDLPDIIHAVIGGSVNFHNIHGSSCIDCPAGGAFITGASVYRMFTVYCFCQYLGNGRLAGSSCAAEKIGVGQLSGGDGVLQRRGEGFLPYDGVESRGPVFAGRYDVFFHDG